MCNCVCGYDCLQRLCVLELELPWIVVVSFAVSLMDSFHSYELLSVCMRMSACLLFVCVYESVVCGCVWLCIGCVCCSFVSLNVWVFCVCVCASCVCGCCVFVCSCALCIYVCRS